MIIKPATHRFGNGESISLLRLFADEEKLLTHNGIDYWSCVDVSDIDGWAEISADDIPVEYSQQ